MEAGGFSIRDYTYRMRKVDVFKCWPFPVDGLTREEIESRLPPMEVRMPSSKRGREEEKNNHPKDEDVCPSDGEPPIPTPPPSSLLTAMGAQPSINEHVADNFGMLTDIQVLNVRLQALRFTVDSEKSDEVNLNQVKEAEEEEKFESACYIDKVFKTISSNLNLKRRRRRTITEIFTVDSEKSDEVNLNQVKEVEEEEKFEGACYIDKVFKAISSNLNLKKRRRRTITEIFNLPS